MIYNACKTMITKGNYEYESMLRKLDMYLLADRITAEQYKELKDLMDAQQPSVAPLNDK